MRGAKKKNGLCDERFFDYFKSYTTLPNLNIKI